LSKQENKSGKKRKIFLCFFSNLNLLWLCNVKKKRKERRKEGKEGRIEREKEGKRERKGKKKRERKLQFLRCISNLS